MTIPPAHDNNTLAIDIEIPRLDDESQRAYNARVAYITAGNGRSLEKLFRNSTKSAQIPRHVKGWSSRFEWVEHAKRYDETLASLAARRKAQQYIEDVEKYQDEYNKTGKAMLVTGLKLLKGLEETLDKMKKDDWKEYITPQMINAMIRMFALSADLRANALQLDALIERLSPADPETFDD